METGAKRGIDPSIKSTIALMLFKHFASLSAKVAMLKFSVAIFICLFGSFASFGNVIEPNSANSNDHDIEVPDVPTYIRKLIGVAEHRFTGGQYENEEFKYRLYVPPTLEDTKKYPLLIWLNGMGQRGKDNSRQLRHLHQSFFWDEDRTKYDFFLLAPQSRPSNNGGVWFGAEKSGDDMLTVLMSILGEVERMYPIDTNRLYVLGVSSGGNATWELGARYPGRFAALVPMASATRIPTNISSFAKTPIWVFHSPTDTVAPPGPVVQLVDMLKRSGCDVSLTMCSDYPEEKKGIVTHYCFQRSFEDTNVEEWIFSQSLGRKSPVLPGARSMDARFFKSKAPRALKSMFYSVVPLVVIVGLIWVCRRELERQKVHSNG